MPNIIRTKQGQYTIGYVNGIWLNDLMDIVREEMGDEVADALNVCHEEFKEEADREFYKANTDLGVYEEELNQLHNMLGEILELANGILEEASKRKTKPEWSKKAKDITILIKNNI